MGESQPNQKWQMNLPKKSNLFTVGMFTWGTGCGPTSISTHAYTYIDIYRYVSMYICDHYLYDILWVIAE